MESCGWNNSVRFISNDDLSMKFELFYCDFALDSPSCMDLDLDSLTEEDFDMWRESCGGINSCDL